MHKIIKTIRDAMNLSQDIFASRLGVSFSTVNRWENEKAYPNKSAQINIYNLATENGVDVAGIVYDKVKYKTDRVVPETDTVLLYHGSANGIKGKIQPLSSSFSDLGSGFYMSDYYVHPLSIITGFENSSLYILSMDFTDLSVLEIKNNIDLAFIVALNQGKLEEYKEKPVYTHYLNMLKDKDVLIGSVTDDRLFYVLDAFYKGNITDATLNKAMDSLKVGRQIVAVSQKACDNINIEASMELAFIEEYAIIKAFENSLNTGLLKLDEITKANRRTGKYFDELLEDSYEQ